MFLDVDGEASRIEQLDDKLKETPDKLVKKNNGDTMTLNQVVNKVKNKN